jgi:hypothetical protein
MTFEGVGAVESLVEDIKWFGGEVPTAIWITLLLLVGGLVVVPLGPDIVALLRRFRNIGSRLGHRARASTKELQ